MENSLAFLLHDFPTRLYEHISRASRETSTTRCIHLPHRVGGTFGEVGSTIERGASTQMQIAESVRPARWDKHRQQKL